MKNVVENISVGIGKRDSEHSYYRNIDYYYCYDENVISFSYIYRWESISCLVCMTHYHYESTIYNDCVCFIDDDNDDDDDEGTKDDELSWNEIRFT